MLPDINIVDVSEAAKCSSCAKPHMAKCTWTVRPLPTFANGERGGGG